MSKLSKIVEVKYCEIPERFMTKYNIGVNSVGNITIDFNNTRSIINANKFFVFLNDNNTVIGVQILSKTGGLISLYMPNECIDLFGSKVYDIVFGVQ